MTGPLCFVLMPFGRKPDPAGGDAIDFDRTYEQAIRPGVVAAGMQPLRADEERLGGIVHKAMFERLLVCDFAVADLTTSNPNVMYELGVRHAARPRTTLTVYAAASPLPFDVRLLRTQQYSLDAGNELTEEAAIALRGSVTTHLRELAALAHDGEDGDSPLFQLLTGWRPEPLPADAADSFRAQVAAAEQVKQRLALVRAAAQDAATRTAAAAELAVVRAETLPGTTDAGVLTELMLAHRALEDWSGMLDVHAAMPAALQRQAEVRQRVAFALNRRAESTGAPLDRADALRILEELELERGPSAETSGLLGRIYKDQWIQACADGDAGRAQALLVRAVRAYLRGFETDWRETYPGINALTLLDVEGSGRSLRQRDALLPVVRFAAERRVRSPRADYWDSATLLEIAVLDGREQEALDRLDGVLASTSERWQPATTARNLRLLRRARHDRGQPVDWLDDVLRLLDAAAGGPPPEVPPLPRPRA